MAAWIDTRWFWTLLILTLCGEFLLPCLLARKDPAYRPGTMAVSVLGRRGGPVARVYRLWLAWLGIWLLTTAAVYAVGAAPASRWLAAGLAVSLGGFALGAGILAALFPTGLTKDLSDRSALIHGIASALGFSPCCSYPSGGRCWRWRQTPRLWRGPALPPWGWRWYSSRCLSSRTKTASKARLWP